MRKHVSPYSVEFLCDFLASVKSYFLSRCFFPELVPIRQVTRMCEVGDWGLKYGGEGAGYGRW